MPDPTIDPNPETPPTPPPTTGTGTEGTLPIDPRGIKPIIKHNP